MYIKCYIINMLKNIRNILTEFLKLTAVALFIGVIIAFYKYLVFLVIEMSQGIFASRDWYTLLYGILLSLILAFASFAILRREPSIRGSGLKILKEHFAKKERDLRWYICIPGMLFNSLITFFLGIPLGMEAPSTFIGAMCGYALDDISRKDNNVDDIKICMGAGFSSAFLSPLAGIFYPFEEQKANINIVNIIKAIYVSFISYYISLVIYDKRLIFIPLTEDFDFSLWPIIIISIVMVVFVSIMIMKLAKGIEFIINKYNDKWFIKYRFFIVYIISLLILIFVPVVGGTGLGLINYLTTHPAYYIIIIFLFVRIILFLLGIYSGASGGAFGTAVTLGALVGYVAVIITNTFLPISQNQALIVMSICACSMFGTVNKAPLTGLGLMITVGNYLMIGNFILPALIIIFIPFIFMHIFKSYKNQ